MKRSHKTIVIIVLQVLFLFALIGVKYYTMSAGTPVLLKASPVDPRDVFRGEYAMLEYDINWLKKENLNKEDLNIENLRNKPVYVLLEKSERYWHAAGIYLDRPGTADSRLFIKGKVVYFDESKDQYRVTYGIESYYVEEGTGKDLQGAGTFDVRVRVDRFGGAVIEGMI